jgi:hypothetical protein
MMYLPDVLVYLRPGAEWSLNGHTYDGLIWHSDEEPPTLAECEAAWSEIERDYFLRPIRAERDALLAASDWTQSADAPVNAKEWAKYRQELRDLPETITDPTQPVTWPSPPK